MKKLLALTAVIGLGWSTIGCEPAPAPAPSTPPAVVVPKDTPPPADAKPVEVTPPAEEKK